MVNRVNTFRLLEGDEDALKAYAARMNVTRAQAIRLLIRSGGKDLFDEILMPDEVAALQRLAAEERRDMRSQAGLIIRQELARLGLIDLTAEETPFPSLEDIDE